MYSLFLVVVLVLFSIGHCLVLCLWVSVRSVSVCILVSFKVSLAVCLLHVVVRSRNNFHSENCKS